MSTLMWNHACTIGVRAMDDQHGILLDALNELRLALLTGVEGSAIAMMVVGVSDLMRLHLDSEDRLLVRHGFPGLATHRAESSRLLGRLAQFEVRFERRQRDAIYQLVEYLRRWFTSHTGVAGRAYGPWLQEQGVR